MPKYRTTICDNCGSDISRREISEEAFELLRDNSFAAIDRGADDISISENEIAIIRGMCSDCYAEYSNDVW